MKGILGKIEYAVYKRKLERLGLREVIIWSGEKKLASIGLE